MSYKTALFVGALALANVHVAFARQPEIRAFDEPPGRFQLIEPGFQHKPEIKTDTGLEGRTSARLEREFNNLAHERSATSPPGIVQNLSIPSWMRSAPRVLTPNLILPPMASLSTENCGQVRYSPHPSLNASQEIRRERYFQQMAAAACRAGVSVELFDALIIQESRYNPLALSTKGASGLTQLMPGTARSLGVFDRWSVSQNLLGGARYLRKQLDTFGNWAHALGAYNAGPGSVSKYGGVPPFRETREYVRTILSSIDMYRRSRGGTGGTLAAPRRSLMLASFTP